MNFCLLWVLAAMLLLSATGCSILVAAPPTAQVQIDGLNSPIGKFAIALNPSRDDPQMDIQLGHRYALRLDFRWLWDQQNLHSQAFILQDPDDFNTAWTPWMTCKYRF